MIDDIPLAPAISAHPALPAGFEALRFEAFESFATEFVALLRAIEQHGLNPEQKEAFRNIAYDIEGLGRSLDAATDRINSYLKS